MCKKTNTFKLSLILLLTCLSNQVASKEILIDKIIAVINEDIKTLSDLKHYKNTIQSRKAKMPPEEYDKLVSNEKNLLDSMINESLLAQYAKEHELAPSPEEIEEFILRRLRSLGMSQKDLQKQLASAGQTIDDLKNELSLEQIKARIFERDLKKKINVSERDYEELFRKEFKQEVNITEYDLAIITLEDKSKARQVYQEVKKGLDFNSAVQTYGGGDLGYIAAHDILPELSEAVKTMQAGDIKGPIKTSVGFQIIKVEKTRNSINPEYVRNKELIERGLVEKQFQHQLNVMLEEIKNNSYVKINI
jgi:peptidyl-prolyl cis-trans isomerase SurA